MAVHHVEFGRESKELNILLAYLGCYNQNKGRNKHFVFAKCKRAIVQKLKHNKTQYNAIQYSTVQCNGKGLEISVNFRKLWKRFKLVFEKLKRFMKLLENFRDSSKVFSRCFTIFFKSSENLRKSSEVFGNFRKFSENFGNGSKVSFRCFYDFLKIFRKYSEIFGSVRKLSEAFRMDWKCS